MSFTVEFVGALANTPVDLISVDTSNLPTSASTINVVHVQTGVEDTPVSPATNAIAFDPLVQTGHFSLQHPNFNSGSPVDVSVNNVALHLDSVTTGTVPVIGPQAVFTMHLSSAPFANFEELSYQGDNSHLLVISSNGNSVLYYGSTYSSIQDALNAHFGTGVWTITGSPSLGGDIVFTGPSQTFGSCPWAIVQDDWGNVGVTVTTSFSDGFAGIPQTYVLTLGGAPTTGNLNLHYGPYQFIIPYTGTNVNLNGTIYANIQTALDQFYSGAFGDSGGWTCVGSPSSGTTITFHGPQATFGSQIWTINSNQWDVSVSDSWTDGAMANIGAQAQHSFYIEGAFGGTFAINSFSGIPWNIDVETLATYWGNNTGQVVTPFIAGSGTSGDPWIITYHDPEPVSLPTINTDNLVGFSDAYLYNQLDSSAFIVTGINPYTLTSAANGSGQTAITVANIDMISGVSITQPTTRTAGSAGTGGAQANFTITTDIVPSSSFIQIMYTGIIFDIKINADNTDENGDSIQTRLNNIGLGGWTYSGSPASKNMVFTRNAQQHYGSDSWSITDDNWGGVQISSLFTDGAYPTGTATAIQTWVSPEHQGATGGTFFIVGQATTVGPCAWNISLGDLSTCWAAATGYSIPWSTNPGTIVAPYEFHFGDNAAITLPVINGSGLTKDGTINNNFTDGTSAGGQTDIQTVSLADAPTGGTWGITLDSSTLSPLDYNIAVGDLQAALRSAWSDAQITVSGTSPYQITFADHAPKSLITADGSDLIKSINPTIVRVKAGQNYPA